MYVSQNKIIEAIDILKQALKTLGINLPKNPTEVSPLPEIIKFKLKFGKRKAEDLLKLPLMTDIKSLAIMRLLNASVAPAFIAQPNLFPVIVLKMVNLSLSKGNASLTPFAYSAFGIILGSALGDYQTGEAFGNLAIELIRVLGDKTKPIECRSVFLVVNMVNHWRHHAKLGEVFFMQSIDKGRGNGRFAIYLICFK